MRRLSTLQSHTAVGDCFAMSAGGSKGRVQIFDLQDGQEVGSYAAAADTVNGFQFHPFLPLAATASGEQL